MRATAPRKRARSASRRSPQHQREQSDDQQQAARYEADGIGSQHDSEIGRTQLCRHRGYGSHYVARPRTGSRSPLIFNRLPGMMIAPLPST